MSQETCVKASERLCEKLGKARLLLDTSALIEASNVEDFCSFLMRLSDNGLLLMTIPEVVDEFTRAAVDLRQYERYKTMLVDLGVVVWSDRVVDFEAVGLEKFFFVYNQAARDGKKLPSCTDYKLCQRLFLVDGLKLLSGNHRDIPVSIFDREDLITIDHGRELHVEAIYALNKVKYREATKVYYK